MSTSVVRSCELAALAAVSLLFALRPAAAQRPGSVEIDGFGTWTV